MKGGNFSMESEAEIVLGMKVDTRAGRQLGKTVSGEGKAEAEIGAACEGGANAIAKALKEALSEALSALGEEIANSDRVRKAMQ